jgi:glycosyltransferase involved in cell wall biosynthesis
MTKNVRVQPPPHDNRRLYDLGDVCVQPSHFEGLGLQLLECQAAGMPLVTTDAPPMNEYQPFATIPVNRTEIISCFSGPPFAAQLMTPDGLVRVLETLHGTDITEASRRARESIEREHSWNRAAPLLKESLVVL